MNIEETLYRIEHLAQQRENDAQAHAVARDIAGGLGGRPTRLIETEGMRRTDEGFETPMTESERVGLGVALPAREVRWNLRPGRYRVRLRLDKPGHVSAYGEDGSALFERRRVIGESTLDIHAGVVTLTATTPIIRLDVTRYVRRLEGSILLGPFPANGRVSARAIGHGDWTCEVASDYVTGRTLDLSGAPSLAGTLDLWRGRSEGYDEGEGEPTEGLPWSQARLIGQVPDPVFTPGPVECGRVVASAEDVTFEKAGWHGGPGKAYWRGLGEWAMLAGREAPAFTETPHLWTYVWGTASGYEACYNMRTGRRCEADTEGFYVVRGRRGEVEIQGTHGAEGMPFLQGEEGMLAAGTWREIQYRQNPQGVLVRVQGSGLLRGIEITIEETTHAPDGQAQTRTRREDLNTYHDASGPGLFLPIT